MTLNEHYKFHSRKSIKPYSKFFIFIVLILTVTYTMARFISGAIGNAELHVAKWSVLINDEQVDTSSSTLQSPIPLLNSLDGSTDLQAGDECYFEIEIDPTSTEVGITYSIVIDLTTGDNPLPSGSSIERYDLYIGDSLTVIDSQDVNHTAKTITESIDLTNNQPLDTNSIRRYRIYCYIPDDATITDGEEFNVNPTISVSQDV